MNFDTGSNQPESTDDLQFETAEPASAGTAAVAAPAQTCVVCHRPIASTYFAIRGKVLCPPCCEQVNAPPSGTPAGRVLKAVITGVGAGLVGAVIWYAIRRATNYELAIIAIFVGVMVGKAVRKASGNRGGRGYQVLAVLLTYSCISANYMPDVFEAFRDIAHKHQTAGATAASPGSAATNSSSPTTQSATTAHKKPGTGMAIVALILLAIITFGVALAAPILGAMHAPIGLLIIGIGLWQAWKINTPRSLAITGPYQVGSGGVVI